LVPSALELLDGHVCRRSRSGSTSDWREADRALDLLVDLRLHRLAASLG
jgi:hypothetical protein